MTTTQAIQAGQMLAQFERAGDRYRHIVSLVQADRVTRLLESIEGSPEQDWPPSPALQQLQIESRGGSHSGPLSKGEGAESPQLVALLVGMAGRSHWSLGIESVPGAERSGIQFDAACRLRAGASRLGSCYRVLVPARVDSESRSVLLEADGHACRLHVEAVDGNAARLELADSLLTIQPVAAEGDGARDGALAIFGF